MFVKQISIFLENKSGRLAEVTNTLAEMNIDISALSIADTTDFGVLRLIVNQPEAAVKALKNAGFAVSLTDVIAVAVNDVPGSLAKALSILNDEKVEIEYMYAFVGKATDKALVILKVEELERAVKVLVDNDVEVLTSEQVYKL